MTRFQLRRLALQATRRPELSPVLQDALLESPNHSEDFGRTIERAHTEHADPGSIVVVVWDPGSIYYPFAVYHREPADLDPTRFNSFARLITRTRRIPVYVRRVPEARIA